MNKKYIEAIKHSKDSKQSKQTFTISKPEASSSKTQPVFPQLMKQQLKQNLLDHQVGM